jgi:Phage Mu protein F like protein
MLVVEAKTIQTMRHREEQILRSAFMRFARRARAPAIIAAMMRNRTVDGVMRLLQPHIEAMGAELPKSIIRIAQNEVRLARAHRSKFRKGLIFKQDDDEEDDDDWLSIDLSFDPGNERAADLLRSSSLDFIDDFTRKQRRTVSRALSRSMSEGEGYDDAARSIRDAIGLTDNQSDAVDNYRNLLQGSSASALDRELRDRRFDGTVSRAVDTGSILDDSQIDRMVDSYTNNMIAYRANTIARTEGQRALAVGRREAWMQLSDQMDMDDDNITRTWNTVMDGRERDTHAGMNGQQVIGLDEPFMSPSGAMLLHPMDPDAPPEEVINCRCVETYDVDFA